MSQALPVLAVGQGEAIVAIVVIRFFWRHLLKYLFQGCLVILVIVALLAIAHYYFKVF